MIIIKNEKNKTSHTMTTALCKIRFMVSEPPIMFEIFANSLINITTTLTGNELKIDFSHNSNPDVSLDIYLRDIHLFRIPNWIQYLPALAGTPRVMPTTIAVLFVEPVIVEHPPYASNMAFFKS
ncbi:MAG: hypothetical protein [brine shrimp arlivirus 3]|nr:MAG: hypothetical protein [brine shrimp arlivirus 3]